MKISTNILEAKKYLEQSKIIAIPTETVYGLAANIYDESAIRSIYSIKKRPLTNPLIVHIKSKDELAQYTFDAPEKALLLAETFWPGPLTLVLPKSEKIPSYISAYKDTVALRVPAHEMALQLLNCLSFPLAAPSANPSNRVSPTNANHVKGYFESEIPFILDGGECKKGLESTIIGFENKEPVLYRLGALPVETIEKVIGPIKIKNNTSTLPDAPGMFSKHYAPTIPLYIIDDLATFLEETSLSSLAYLSFNKKYIHPKIKATYMLSEKKDLKQAAKNLYRTLIHIDSKNYDAIITQLFPEKEQGKAINDRLKRASCKL